MLLSRNLARVFACVLCGLLMVGLGCGGDSQPKITLKAINCETKYIKLTATIKKTKDPSRTTTTVTIKVTCMDEPVDMAELHVDFWGLFTKTVMTDETGEAKASQVTQLDTTGLEVTVTIEGSDGEREVVVEPVPE